MKKYYRGKPRVGHTDWRIGQVKKMNVNQEDLGIQYNAKYIIGLDECGWGAIFGPCAVGCVALEADSDLVVKDSKKYSSERLRKKDYNSIASKASHAEIQMASAYQIDKYGAAKAREYLIFTLLKNVTERYQPDECVIVIDGSYIPKHLPKWLNQYRVIAIPQADAKIKAVSAASVLAKVRRDDLMHELGASENYAKYDIAQCKGYCSPAHLSALRTHGPSDLHRRSISLVRKHIKDAER